MACVEYKVLNESLFRFLKGVFMLGNLAYADDDIWLIGMFKVVLVWSPVPNSQIHCLELSLLNSSSHLFAHYLSLPRFACRFSVLCFILDIILASDRREEERVLTPLEDHSL